MFGSFFIITEDAFFDKSAAYRKRQKSASQSAQPEETKKRQFFSKGIELSLYLLYNRDSKIVVDKVTAIRWKSAPTTRDAFIDEYLMQKRFGVF